MGPTQQRVERGGRLVKTVRGVVSLAAVVVTASVLPLFAQETCIQSEFDGSREMCDLNPLGTMSASQAFGISGDGSTTVGLIGEYYDEEFKDFFSNRAAAWSVSSGWRPLETLPDQTSGRAVGASFDGSILAGQLGTSAVRWVNGQVTDLGIFPNESPRSVARAISSDGSTIVGWGRTTEGARAFRWTEQGGLENLGTLGGSSYANGVNADGTVVVGTARGPKDTYSIVYQPFQWTEQQGMTFLETQPVVRDGRTYISGGRAYDVNDSGDIIVGISKGAVRWVDGRVQSLGSLLSSPVNGKPTVYDIAYATNSDGTIIVGEANSENGIRAFRWVEGSQDGVTHNPEMQNLGVLTGQWRSSARGVSADGEIVVGNSGDRAFIWRATDDGGTMEDHANLITSFPVLGNDSAVMQAEQQFVLGALIGSGGLAQAGEWSFSTQLGVQSTGRNPTTVGARTTSLAALSFGRGITDTFTLGATISAQGSSLQNNAFDMDTGFAGAIWGTYSAGGADRTGLQASGSLGYARNSGDISRGRLLTDVALATGQSSVETRAVQASFGYGMTQGDWLVTPRLGVAHYDTTRAGYAESGAAFNASYDAMTTSRTVATLAVSGDMKLGEHGRLSLGAGVEHDLSVTAPRLTGTSDIPGLATFDIGSTFQTNKTRGFVTAGYTHDFGNGQSLGGTVRVGQAVYGSTPSVGVGVNYGFRF